MIMRERHIGICEIALPVARCKNFFAYALVCVEHGDIIYFCHRQHNRGAQPRKASADDCNVVNHKKTSKIDFFIDIADNLY